MSSNVKDLEKSKLDKLENLEKEEEFNKIDCFENNFDLKVSLINIDSNYRNLIPKNITDGKPIFLKKNSIYVTENSNLVKIYYPNHLFSIGDKIIIQNVTAEKIINKNSFYLVNNFDYLIINFNNHSYTNNFNKLDNKIVITSFNKLDNSRRLLGNIPLNSILGIKKIFTKSQINITFTILEYILENLNISEAELDENYIFIKLPFEYSNISKIKNNIINYTDFFNIDIIFTISKLDIGGIPLQYLNANFPINSKQYRSSYFITNVEPNFIYINCDVKGNYNENNGQDKTYISKVINSIEGFTKPNSYIIDLKKSFTNVVRIELLSTEIPFIEFNVTNNVTKRNNKLYWQNLEDGDYIYEIEIDEGSYLPSSLVTKILEKLNSTPRIYSTDTNKSDNFFELEINVSSQEVVFKSFKFEFFPNSLKIEKDNTLVNVSKLIITIPNNYVTVGDIIIISGSTSIGDILASFINTEHTVIEVNKINDSFTVLINTDTNIENLNIDGTGGSFTKIKIPILSRFFFNYSDTIGKLLGFKNIGDPNSITKFSHKISNNELYDESTPFDEIGNINDMNSIINFTANYFYFFMYLNDLEGVISNTNASNPFAKILLTGNNGDIMFNTFIPSPLELDIPISLINNFQVTFRYPDNELVDFKNINHSFTLRITEKILRPVRTNILSNRVTYQDSLITKHFLDNN